MAEAERQGGGGEGPKVGRLRPEHGLREDRRDENEFKTII